MQEIDFSKHKNIIITINLKPRKMKKIFILFVGIVFCSSISFGQQGQLSKIKVGAAKVNITPSIDELGPNSLGIHDSVYCRAIVIDNGKTRAALITVAGNQSERSWTASAEKMQKELGIPVENVVLSSTHSHSVGRIPELEEKIFIAKYNLKLPSEAHRLGYRCFLHQCEKRFN